MSTKNLLVIALALGLAGCDGCTDTNTYPLLQPEHEYELDTWGYNSEVYEFTPKSNPGYTCVMLMLDNGRAVGFQCFAKTTPPKVDQS